MDATDIEGEYNETLHEDAMQFGGEGESTTVPTHHLRVTTADLANLVETGEPVKFDGVALCVAFTEPDVVPDQETIVMTENATQRLASGDILNYGIRQINGTNKHILISRGGISDLHKTDMSPRERLQHDSQIEDRHVP